MSRCRTRLPNRHAVKSVEGLVRTAILNSSSRLSGSCMRHMISDPFGTQVALHSHQVSQTIFRRFATSTTNSISNHGKQYTDNVDDTTLRTRIFLDASIKNKQTKTVENGILVREFIGSALYQTESGYFTAKDVLGSPPPLRYHQFLGLNDYRNAIIEAYRSGDNIWLTPSEIYKPFYAHAVARWILSHILPSVYTPQRKEKTIWFPTLAGITRESNLPFRNVASPLLALGRIPVRSRDPVPFPLRIVEIGGGKGSLAKGVLDYLEEFAPDVYATCQYTTFEVSPIMAKAQRDLIHPVHGDHFRCVEADGAQITPSLAYEASRSNISFKDKLRVDPTTTSPLSSRNSVMTSAGGGVQCPVFVLATEVLDNMPHDKVVMGTDGMYYEVRVESTTKQPPTPSDSAVPVELLSRTAEYREFAVPVTDPVLKETLEHYISFHSEWTMDDDPDALPKGSILPTTYHPSNSQAENNPKLYVDPTSESSSNTATELAERLRQSDWYKDEERLNAQVLSEQRKAFVSPKELLSRLRTIRNQDTIRPVIGPPPIVYLPTHRLKFLINIAAAFPSHRMFLADFDSLITTERRPADWAPVISRRSPSKENKNNSTSNNSGLVNEDLPSYLMDPGTADIFFPSDFPFLSYVYSRVVLGKSHPTAMARLRTCTTTPITITEQCQQLGVPAPHPRLYTRADNLVFDSATLSEMQLQHDKTELLAIVKARQERDRQGRQRNYEEAEEEEEFLKAASAAATSTEYANYKRHQEKQPGSNIGKESGETSRSQEGTTHGNTASASSTEGSESSTSSSKSSSSSEGKGEGPNNGLLEGPLFRRQVEAMCVPPRLWKQADFLARYGELDGTACKNGYNPMLEDYTNMTVFVAGCDGKHRVNHRYRDETNRQHWPSEYALIKLGSRRYQSEGEKSNEGNNGASG